MTGAALDTLPPLITVVIPHLNQPEALSRCLASLQRQNFPDEAFEVIVVDNGSNSIPETVVTEFPGVRLLEETVPGPGPARNRGVEAARGKILAFTDADCIVDKNWLRAISEEFIKFARSDVDKRSILGGKVEIVIENPANPTAIEAYEMVFSYRQQMYIERKGFSVTCNLAVEVDAFHRIGPFGGISIAEDNDWCERATSLGHQISYVPEMIVRHPAREDINALFVKWNRQIHHQFEAHVTDNKSISIWCLRAIMIGLSPIIDVWRVVGLNQPIGARAKLSGCLVLLAVRLSRMHRMLTFAYKKPAKKGSPKWNTSFRS